MLNSLRIISPIDPTKELLRWGPVPGNFFYMSEFLEACFTRFAARFPGVGVPAALLLFNSGRFLYLHQLAPFHEACKKMFLDIMMVDDFRAQLVTEWHAVIRRQEAVQVKIASTNLSSLSDVELRQLWDEFFEVTIEFWIPTIAAEFGNYGSDQLLAAALAVSIKDKTQLDQAMEVLTAPEALSFYQEEEIDLSEATDLSAHQQKYYWLKNSYAGSQVLPVEFFADRKLALPERVRVHQLKRIDEVKTKKQTLIQEHNLAPETVKLASVLRQAIEWQDERKKYIFQTLHFKDVLLKHLAERYGYDYKTLLNYGFEEVEKFVFSSEQKETYQSRNTGCAVSMVPNSPSSYSVEISTLSSDDVAAAWKEYLAENVAAETREFKGTIACVGNGQPVRGTVRVLLDPNQSEKFIPGEILVAPMTSPEYVFVMKIAAAILTDTGGLTSHAAIVSRELNVPCLVGTKVATHVLKDGDLVEVDASRGIVRKI